MKKILYLFTIIFPFLVFSQTGCALQNENGDCVIYDNNSDPQVYPYYQFFADEESDLNASQRMAINYVTDAYDITSVAVDMNITPTYVDHPARAEVALAILCFSPNSSGEYVPCPEVTNRVSPNGFLIKQGTTNQEHFGIVDFIWSWDNCVSNAVHCFRQYEHPGTPLTFPIDTLHQFVPENIYIISLYSYQISSGHHINVKGTYRNLLTPANVNDPLSIWQKFLLGTQSIINAFTGVVQTAINSTLSLLNYSNTVDFSVDFLSTNDFKPYHNIMVVSDADPMSQASQYLLTQQNIKETVEYIQTQSYCSGFDDSFIADDICRTVISFFVGNYNSSLKTSADSLQEFKKDVIPFAWFYKPKEDAENASSSSSFIGFDLNGLSGNAQSIDGTFGIDIQDTVTYMNSVPAVLLIEKWLYIALYATIGFAVIYSGANMIPGIRIK